MHDRGRFTEMNHLHNQQKTVSYIIPNKSHRKILHNKGPRIDPFGTPNKISAHELCTSN